SNPAAAHKLLDKITQTTILYLKDQVSAGAQIVQIFDSWGGILGVDTYNDFSLKYISKICDELSKLVPVIAFPKGAFFAANDIAKLNCRAIGLDWTASPKEARNILKGKTLQGNLDPCVLYADKEIIKKSVDKMIADFGTQNYIANLGHGVYPDTPADNVQYFVEAVKAHRP